MLKQEAVKSIESQKHQMISALYANTNWDSEPEKRTERIKELERHFSKAIELVYDPKDQDEEEPDWNNPFWAAAKRAYDRKLEKLRGERGEGTVGDVIDMDREQLEARRRSRQNIDQT